MSPPNYLIISFVPWLPFQITGLPFMGKLLKLVYRRYSKRWKKRLLKKPVRWAFDFCYHMLKLGGIGRTEYFSRFGRKEFIFDIRKVHFSILYLEEYEKYGYEPDVSSILSWLFRGHKDGVFFDIGANWGFFSFYVASLEFYSGIVHAFEPIPDTIQDLRQFVTQGQLETRLTAHQLALSDAPGNAGMAVIDPLSSGVTRICEGEGDYLVEKATLDSMKLPTPEVMKIDVEEHEFQVLNGAREILKKGKPYVIFENWLHSKPDHCLRPLRLMESMGYVLYYPCWYYGEWKNGFLSAELMPDPDSDKLSLCLCLFQSEDRYLFKDQINVLAIHRDRLSSLPEGVCKVRP